MAPDQGRRSDRPHEDEPDILDEAPLSVKTGRSLEEIGPARPAKSLGQAGTPPSEESQARRNEIRQYPRSALPLAAKPAPRTMAPSKSPASRLTHPDRVLWEDQGLTKQELAEYLLDIAEWLLPHLANRPLTLIRCPCGAEKDCFVQRHSWAGMSDFIHRTMIAGRQRRARGCCPSRDIQGVVALVQAGVLEMHVWGATLSDLERPDRLDLRLRSGRRRRMAARDRRRACACAPAWKPWISKASSRPPAARDFTWSSL